jgi:hypothetical protein
MKMENKTQDHQVIREFVGRDGLVVFYLNHRVDEYNEEIANIEAMERKETIVTITGSFLIEPVEHFQANEERLGNFPRCFSMVPATKGEINGYFAAGRRGEFSTTVPHSLSVFVGARVMLLKKH